jgi:riboflavin biosynthesis pyrimidine reductase
VSDGGPRFRVLHPGAGAVETVQAAGALAGWRESREPAPGVTLNFIASADGRIAVAGRSAPLGGAADRALFHALRAQSDAVLVGAGTVRDERYGPLVKPASVRQARRRAGLREQPVALVASSSLELDPELPLLADPESHVVVLTASDGELAPCAAHVEYERGPAVAHSLAAARARLGLRVVLCEGGPALAGSLAAAGLVDELFLTLSPMIVGDRAGSPTMLRGAGPAEPLAMRLAMLLESDGLLFARYVGA